MIETLGLSKRFGKQTAVDELSFTVRPGRVTGFLGPNGAGKSTTMRMILGLDRPDAGQALIDGKPYAELKNPLRTVGALLDASWVHPQRTAKAHLEWLAVSNGIPRSRAMEVLEQVGLTKAAGRRAGGFSLGMAQRLGIAGAILGDPGVLLFDEPVNGLDPEGVLWVRRFLQRLAAEGRAVLVSSHLLAEMALTAEDLVVIGKGKLIAQCGTEEFISNAAEAMVRVRSPQDDRLRQVLGRERAAYSVDGDALLVSGMDTERLGDLAAANAITLHELSPRRGSLEEAFLRLTGDSVEYQAAGGIR